MAMRQYGERYPIGNRHLKMVDELFEAVVRGQMQFLKLIDTWVFLTSPSPPYCTFAQRVGLTRVSFLRACRSSCQVFDADYVPTNAARTLGRDATTQLDGYAPQDHAGVTVLGLRGSVVPMGNTPDSQFSGSGLTPNSGNGSGSGSGSSKVGPGTSAASSTLGQGEGLTPFLDLLNSVSSPGPNGGKAATVEDMGTFNFDFLMGGGVDGGAGDGSGIGGGGTMGGGDGRGTEELMKSWGVGNWSFDHESLTMMSHWAGSGGGGA